MCSCTKVFYIDNILPLKSKGASQKEINETYKLLKYSDLKQKYPFLKEVEACVLQQAARDCDTAFMNFFISNKRQIKGERRGFPKFKSKHDNNSALFPCEAISKSNSFETRHIIFVYI